MVPAGRAEDCASALLASSSRLISWCSAATRWSIRSASSGVVISSRLTSGDVEGSMTTPIAARASVTIAASTARTAVRRSRRARCTDHAALLRSRTHPGVRQTTRAGGGQTPPSTRADAPDEAIAQPRSSRLGRSRPQRRPCDRPARAGARGKAIRRSGWCGVIARRANQSRRQRRARDRSPRKPITPSGSAT